MDFDLDSKTVLRFPKDVKCALLLTYTPTKSFHRMLKVITGRVILRVTKFLERKDIPLKNNT